MNERRRRGEKRTKGRGRGTRRKGRMKRTRTRGRKSRTRGRGGKREGGGRNRNHQKISTARIYTTISNQDADKTWIFFVETNCIRHWHMLRCAAGWRRRLPHSYPCSTQLQRRRYLTLFKRRQPPLSVNANSLPAPDGFTTQCAPATNAFLIGALFTPVLRS